MASVKIDFTLTTTQQTDSLPLTSTNYKGSIEFSAGDIGSESKTLTGPPVFLKTEGEVEGKSPENSDVLVHSKKLQKIKDANPPTFEIFRDGNVFRLK